ncbi:enterotoxin A family protein [Parasalinivibrio latis]|uniref:scabin-related ADP-ribosyltransferase n=1 Tax=Parasalinivibrio latis TaxID=2952610 RepID=UPI0030E0F554
MFDVVFNQKSGSTPRRSSNGFEARGDSTDLLAHALDNTSPPNNYVSTSKSADVASSFNENVYVVRPQNGVDVNATLGSQSPFPDELEIAIPGGVEPSDIRAVTQGNVSILNPEYKP